MLVVRESDICTFNCRAVVTQRVTFAAVRADLKAVFKDDAVETGGREQRNKHFTVEVSHLQKTRYTLKSLSSHLSVLSVVLHDVQI